MREHNRHVDIPNKVFIPHGPTMIKGRCFLRFHARDKDGHLYKDANDVLVCGSRFGVVDIYLDGEEVPTA